MPNIMPKLAFTCKNEPVVPERDIGEISFTYNEITVVFMPTPKPIIKRADINEYWLPIKPKKAPTQIIMSLIIINGLLPMLYKRNLPT